MADGTIIIKIVQDDSKPDTPVDATGEKQTEKTTSSDLKTALMTTVLQKAGNAIKEMGIDSVMYTIDRALTRTDDYMAQQNLGIAKSIAGKAISIGIGYAVGGPVLGTVNLLIQAAKTGINAAKNVDQQNIRMTKMNAQLSFSRERAGWALTAGRGENR